MADTGYEGHLLSCRGRHITNCSVLADDAVQEDAETGDHLRFLASVYIHMLQSDHQAYSGTAETMDFVRSSEFHDAAA